MMSAVQLFCGPQSAGRARSPPAGGGLAPPRRAPGGGARGVVLGREGPAGGAHGVAGVHVSPFLQQRGHAALVAVAGCADECGAVGREVAPVYEPIRVRQAEQLGERAEVAVHCRGAELPLRRAGWGQQEGGES